ncbi:hypothetical protein D9M69_732470 [compost metagenome]
MVINIFLTNLVMQAILALVARFEGALVTPWALLAWAILTFAFGFIAVFHSARATDNKKQ